MNISKENKKEKESDPSMLELFLKQKQEETKALKKLLDALEKDNFQETKINNNIKIK